MNEQAEQAKELIKFSDLTSFKVLILYAWPLFNQWIDVRKCARKDLIRFW